MLEKYADKYYLSEDCYISKVDNGISASEHTHDFLEIVYNLGGRSVHYVNDEAYPIGPGDALFINYGSTHRFEVLEKTKYVDIIIKPQFISESLMGVENAFALLDLENFRDFSEIVDRNSRFMNFSGAERKQIEDLIFWAHDEQETTKPGSELVIRSIFNTLLTLVFRKMALPMKTENAFGAGLLDYIKAHCSEPLTMERIAAKNNYNPAYFSRLFKKFTGHTFTEYLTDCRLELALELLRDTELKVDEVALESGFSDRTKFYKIFSERIGTTPLKYRKSKK